jgi:tetratricopeptide (TPR) repeat protein
MSKQASLAAVGAMVLGLVPAAWGQGQAGQCDIKTTHFAVTRAILYIQNATGTQDTLKRREALEGARRSLTEALQGGLANDPSVWYFMGIYYALSGDGEGADSAFDKTEAAMPGCKEDISQYRQVVWAKVANQGIEGMRNNDYERAKDRFRLANELYQEDPTASFYLGTIFATEDNADSALHYYKLAARIAAGDTAQAEIHEKSVQNVARIYEVLEEWDSAAAWFGEYRKIRPDDPEGLTGHARSLLAAGDTAGAIQLYQSILDQAQMMDPMDLFRVGVSLFRTDNAGMAAKAFELGLERNPYYRNGLFNLVNAYFQLAQDAQGKQRPDSARFYASRMLPAAHRLRQVDPQNQQVVRLIAAAHQLLGNDDSTDVWLRRANQMTFQVEVQLGREAPGGYEVVGTISNLRSQATNVPAITFEFLNAQGQVVATETISAQTIEPNGIKQFQLNPSGEGIVAWRYKTG